MRCLGALPLDQIRDFRLSTLVDSNCSCYEPATMGDLRADKVRCFGASLDSASDLSESHHLPQSPRSTRMPPLLLSPVVGQNHKWVAIVV
jgi:hypothetical protein